jgi:nucleoside triphosphatase
MKRRLIVVPIIKNFKDELLICKMPSDYGVFPGQWGLPGGGVEDGETISTALEREIFEELGIHVSSFKPWLFRDDFHSKVLKDGSKISLYMIYLVSIHKQ